MPFRSIASEPWQRLGTRVAFDQNSAADHAVVAAVAGTTYRILAWRLTIASAVNLTWKSGSTAISGVYVFGSGGVDEGLMPFQAYETAAGEALNLTLSGAVRVSGDIWYESY